MDRWKSPYIKTKLRPFLFQFFRSGLYSSMGMFLMSCLLLTSQNNGSAYGLWDECIFNLLIIIFLFNNVNLTFLIISHLLKILPFFIYFNIGVLLEASIYYFLVYIFVYIYSFNPLISSIFPTLVFFAVLFVLRLCSMRPFISIVSKYKSMYESTDKYFKYFFGKKTDISICIILPLIPLIIILINILSGI